MADFGPFLIEWPEWHWVRGPESEIRTTNRRGVLRLAFCDVWSDTLRLA